MGYKLYSRGYIDLGANTICLPCFITTSYTKLYNEFLQNIGGINGNTFVKFLNSEIDEKCEENCPKLLIIPCMTQGHFHQHYKLVKINLPS